MQRTAPEVPDRGSPTGGKAAPAPSGATGKDVGGVRRESVALIRRMRDPGRTGSR